MSAHNVISCPNCGKPVDIDEVLAQQAGEKYRKEYEEKLVLLRAGIDDEKKKLEEDKRRMDEYKAAEKEKFEKKLHEELKAREEKTRLELEQRMKERFTLELESLKKENEERKNENQALRRKELDLLTQEKRLLEMKENLEIDTQRKILENQKQVEAEVRKQEADRREVMKQEYEKKLADQQKLAEEMQRKAQQGSMQLQGEVQELALEELLKAAFPHDKIEEVGKGVKGADVIQHVFNPFQQACGKIIYESKRTKAFSQGWIDKLKGDLRGQQADIAVIVTEAMPQDMQHFGVKDGVWICSFAEAKSLALVLRDGLMKVHQAMASQENKGDKMHMLYDFLTGNEFRQQIEAIVEGFTAMQSAIRKERNAMEAIWKEREKQIDKVLLNTSHLYGSVRGIAGNAIRQIDKLELPEGNAD